MLFSPFLLHVVLTKEKKRGGEEALWVDVWGRWWGYGGIENNKIYIYTYTTMGKEIDGGFLRYGICHFFISLVEIRGF